MKRFEIQKEMGRGSFGTIFLATDLENQAQKVALKVLHAQSQQHLQSFLAEAELLAKLNHPAFPKYVAHGRREDQTPFLAMQWIDGVTLHNQLENVGLSSHQCLRLAIRLCDALLELHRQGFVFRDLKPTNVLIPPSGEQHAMLVDFGSVIDRSTIQVQHEKQSRIVGTPGYMSPEQARGVSPIGPASDLFSLGCILYECLSGRPAYIAPNINALLAKVAMAYVTPLTFVRPEIPKAISLLCASLLTVDIASRDVPIPRLQEAIRYQLTVTEDLPAPPRKNATSDISLDQQFQVVTGGMMLSRSDGQLDHTAIEDKVSAMLAMFEYSNIRVLKQSAVVIASTQKLSDASALANAFGRIAVAICDQYSGVRAAAVVQQVPEMSPEWEHRVVDRLALLLDHVPNTVITDAMTLPLLDEDLRVRFTIDDGHTRPISHKFVGRKEELQLLRELLLDSFEDHRCIVCVISGQQGVGRTTLAKQFISSLSTEKDLSLVWQSGDLFHSRTPLAFCTALLRLLLGGPLGKVSAHEVLQIESLCPFRDKGEREAFCKHARQLLTPHKGARPSEELPQFSEIAQHLLCGCLAGKQTILVLDNIELADRWSLSLLDSVFSSLKATSLLVLYVGSSEFLASAGNVLKSVHCKVSVKEFTNSESLEWLRVNGDPILSNAQMRKWVHRVGGNALALSLLSEVASTVENLSIQPTLTMLLSAKLQTMNERERMVLSAASVFGNTFWAEGLLYLLKGKITPRELEQILNQSLRNHLLFAVAHSQITGTKLLCFSQEAFRLVIVEAIPVATRAQLSESAARWLEETGQINPEQIGSLYLAANSPEQALPWLLLAARWMLASGNTKNAENYCEQMLALVVDQTAQVQLRIERLSILQKQRRLGDVRKESESLMSIVNEWSDEWWGVYRFLYSVLLDLGELHAADTLVGKLTVLPSGWEKQVEASRTLLAIAEVALRFGNLTFAQQTIGSVKNVLVTDHGGDVYLRAHWTRLSATTAFLNGNLCEALDYFRQAAQMYNSILRRTDGFFCVSNAVVILLQLGQYSVVEEDIKYLLDYATKHKFPTYQVLAMYGHWYSRMGQYNLALQTLTTALEIVQKHQDSYSESGIRLYLLEVNGQLGDVANIQQHAAWMINHASQFAPGFLAGAYAVLGRITLHFANYPEALKYSTAGVEIRNKLPRLDVFENLLWLVHAQALFENGQIEQCRTQITLAKRELHRIAHTISNPSWRDTYLYGVPEHAKIIELSKRLSN